MRVLENPATPSYNMGKNKKHKLRKTKEASDSSDDGTTAIPTCNHINMAVNVAAMKKGLLKQTFGECAGCAKEATKNVDKSQSEVVMETSIGAEASVSLYDVEPTLWVCLQCGNQGCDRNSREKHALKHYEAPRSSCHCLVINTTSWTAWCYRCDDEVPIDRSKRIQECVDIIRKHGGISQTDGGTSSVKRPTSGVQVSSSSDQVAKGRPLTPKSSAAGSCQKIKGLSNLGNTCFFNAVMQNLTQTQCLESILVEKSKKGRVVTMSAKHLSDPDSSGSEDSDEEIMSLKDLPAINITLPEAGPLTQSLINFLQEMNNNTGRSGTVNPTALFGQVCKKAQRFRGFQQQDSHELLRYLMDNMRTEEIKRGQTGILKNFKLSENIHPKKVDEETRTKIREYGRQAKQTFIDALFGGHLISTVTCEECRYISQIFEPFLDLSLPVTEEKPQRPNQATAGKKKSVSDVVEEPPAIGIDGFAYKSDKPSKHVQKKMKQQAKKQAKRKGKFVKNQVVPAEGGGEGDEGGEEDVDAGEDGPDQEENKEVTENKDENDEGNSSNKDDPSDADIEDNLESDTSRCQRFADVPVTQDATQESSVQEATCSVDENIQNSNTEMCNSASVTESICEKESYISTTTSAKTVDSQGSDVTATKTVLVNGTTAVENSATIILAENSPSSTITDNSPSSSSTLQYESNGPKVTDNNAEVTSLDAENGGTCNSCLFSDGNVSAEFTIMCNGMTNSSSMEESTEFKKCLNPGEGTTTTDHFRNGTMCNGDITTEDGIDNCRNSVTIDTNGVAKNGVGNSQEMRNADREAQLVDLEARLKNLDLKEAGTVDNVTPTSKIDNLDKSIEDPQNSDKSRQRIDSTDNENCTSKPNSANSLKRSGQNYSRQSSVKHSKSKKEVKKEACMKAKVTLGQRYQPSSRECSIMSCLHQFTSAELLTGNNKFGCSNCTKIKRKQSPSHEKKETVYSNAAKQYLIYVPPAVLTLHLKRFEQVGFSSRKVNRHVEFPFVLDLAPFCSSLCQGVRPGQKKILYALYGVVEHSGRLNTGHYTAYVKVRPNVGITSNFLNSGIPTVQECVQRHTDLISMDGNVDCEESEEVLVEKLVPPGRWYHVSDSRVNETTESIVQRAQAYLLFYERIH